MALAARPCPWKSGNERPAARRIPSRDGSISRRRSHDGRPSAGEPAGLLLLHDPESSNQHLPQIAANRAICGPQHSLRPSGRPPINRMRTRLVGPQQGIGVEVVCHGAAAIGVARPSRTGTSLSCSATLASQPISVQVGEPVCHLVLAHLGPVLDAIGRRPNPHMLRSPPNDAA